MQAAQILAKTNDYIINKEHQKFLLESASELRDPKLRELVLDHGIGYHHAGLDTNDRHLIENLFLKANLLVLCNLIF